MAGEILPPDAPSATGALALVPTPAGAAALAAAQTLAVATRNDERSDAQSRPISSAHYLRL